MTTPPEPTVFPAPRIDGARGLEQRYHITRVDGRPVRWAFALDFDDPHAVRALETYRDEVAQAGHFALSQDLSTKAQEMRERHGLPLADHMPYHCPGCNSVIERGQVYVRFPREGTRYHEGCADREHDFVVVSHPEHGTRVAVDDAEADEVIALEVEAAGEGEDDRASYARKTETRTWRWYEGLREFEG